MGIQSLIRAGAPHYARIALGAAFLSAVGGRFGVWKGIPWTESFPRFIQATAEVNSFLPAASAPFLAWAATTCEITFGVALIIGFRVRWAAAGSSLLLFLFGSAMAISEGVKSPMDYSVFSASAAALLLSCHEAKEDKS